MYFSIAGMEKKSGNSTFTVEEKRKFQALMKIPFTQQSNTSPEKTSTEVKSGIFECFVCEQKTFKSYNGLNQHCLHQHSSTDIGSLTGGKVNCNICDKDVTPAKFVDHLQNLHCKTRIDAKGVVRIPIKKSPFKIDQTYQGDNPDDPDWEPEDEIKCETESDHEIIEEITKPQSKRPRIQTKTIETLNARPMIKKLDESKICDICHTYFMTYQNLLAHRLEIHNIKVNFDCDLCDFIAHLPKDLRRHREIFHGISKKVKTNNEPKCPMANVKDEITGDTYEIECDTDEISGVTNEESVTSVTNENSVTSVKNAKKSRKQVLNTRQEEPVTPVTPVTSQNVYTIDVDSQVSKRVLSIVKQRQEPLEEVVKKFKCDYCEKTFSKDQINDHILTHFSKPKKYICEECDSKFETEKELKNHLKIGHKYKCATCAYKFSSRVTFKIHTCPSNPSLAAQCSDCEYVFQLRHDLKMHRKINHE